LDALARPWNWGKERQTWSGISRHVRQGSQAGPVTDHAVLVTSQ
jgi:hypothetical protein